MCCIGLDCTGVATSSRGAMAPSQRPHSQPHHWHRLRYHEHPATSETRGEGHLASPSPPPAPAESARVPRRARPLRALTVPAASRVSYLGGGGAKKRGGRGRYGALGLLQVVDTQDCQGAKGCRCPKRFLGAGHFAEVEWRLMAFNRAHRLFVTASMQTTSPPKPLPHHSNHLGGRRRGSPTMAVRKIVGLGQELGKST